jgi:hypothetical protein
VIVFEPLVTYPVVNVVPDPELGKAPGADQEYKDPPEPVNVIFWLTLAGFVETEQESVGVEHV